jgi:hypothetical protein
VVGARGSASHARHKALQLTVVCFGGFMNGADFVDGGFVGFAVDDGAAMFVLGGVSVSQSVTTWK